MTLPHVTVVSTGFAAKSKDDCIASVAAQTGVTWNHVYIEASTQTPPRTKIENLIDAIKDLPADRVTVLLDGDDWLARPDALAIVAGHHAAGTWVTLGSFIFADGRPGFAAPYKSDDFRKEPWTGTHLKSFRAGLFQRLRHADLKWYPPGMAGPPGGGEWIDRADDPAFMFGIMEQAGLDRIVFCPENLYVYNLAASFEWSASRAELEHERAIVEHVRSLPKYERLESL